MPPPRQSINQHALRRQRMVLIAGIVLAVGTAVLITQLNRPARSDSAVAPPPRLAVPGAGVDTEQLWRSSAEQDIRVLEDSEQRMRSALTQLEQRIEKMSSEIEQTRIAEQEAAFERELLQLSTMEQAVAEITPNLTSQPSAPPLDLEPPELVSGIRLVKVVQPPAGDAGAAPPAPVPAVPAAQIEPPAPAGPYLPSGSFMPAVILGGIDAPTGAVARDNPHPVLLRVAKMTRLPSLARLDLRECLVLAAGYGDISSERALMRLERMSCQRRDGSFVDVAVRGFIVGEDGRAGVRGRLVTKQGQILQRSLAAGFGAGFGEMLSAHQTGRINTLATTSADDTTVRTTPDLESYAFAGVASGARTALDRLADYYIALADRVHPIIEIGAGRTVDIVLQDGVDLGPAPAPVQ